MLKSQTTCGSYCSCALFKNWRSSPQGAFLWRVALNHTLYKSFASFHNIIKEREVLHISSSVGKMLTLQRWERVACEKAQIGDWVFVWWLQDSQGARNLYIYIYIYKSCHRPLLASPMQCQERSGKKIKKLCPPIYAWRFSWLHFLIIIQGCPWGLIAFWILIFATACLLSIRPANLFFINISPVTIQQRQAILPDV